MILKKMIQATLCAAGLSLAAPAMAQPGGMPEEVWEKLGCVYTGISALEDEPFFAIINAHLDEAESGVDYDLAMQAVMPIVSDCADKHDLDDVETEIVVTMGVLGAVSDAIEGNYLEGGMTEEQLDTLVDILDEVSDEDFEALASGEWRNSEAIQKSVKAALRSKGVPDNPMLLADGLYLLEAYLIGSAQVDLWMKHDEQ